MSIQSSMNSIFSSALSAAYVADKAYGWTEKCKLKEQEIADTQKKAQEEAQLKREALAQQKAEERYKQTLEYQQEQQNALNERIRMAGIVLPGDQGYEEAKTWALD